MLPELDSIMLAVSLETGVAVDDIRSRRRATHIVLARQLTIYMIWRIRKDYSLFSIGEYMQRDHTTIIYTIDKIATLRADRPNIAELIRLIEQRIAATPDRPITPGAARIGRAAWLSIDAPNHTTLSA